MEAKDSLLDKAKTTVQSSIESLVEDVKARAAANPAAALMIGAGIAWRLMRHPPIATALVAAGVLSLFRTPPARSNGQAPADYLAYAKTRLMQQASEGAEIAKEKAAALTETAGEKVAALSETAAGKVAETAGRMKERVQDLTAQATATAGSVASAAGGLARDTRQQAAAMLSDTTESLEQRGRSARVTASTAVSRARTAVDQRWELTQGALGDMEARDKLLLGTAGLAVIAALGIACQRRMTEHAE
jgi:hypothetical protein